MFYEKSLGTANVNKYIQHIILLISSVKEASSLIVLLHDGAPSHYARKITNTLSQAGIETNSWPFYSSDLNPIERVLGTVKRYIQSQYPEVAAGTQISQLRLRKAIDGA